MSFTTPADDTDDPIVASYPIYLNPTVPAGRKLIILQHPNRLANALSPSASSAATPSSMRIKPATGMVELDIPIQTHLPGYDRDKGMRWGRALHSATTARAGGALGLPGGFGVGSTATTAAAAGRRRAGGDGDGGGGGDSTELDWSEAVRHDRVLRTQTLGGQIPDSGEVQYMVGVFHGQDIHLTPATSLVHLRPQLHHIDSLVQQQERGSGPAKPDAGAAAAAAAAAAQQQARAIHMTIKSADDGAAVTETMTDRLRSVQLEPWRKLRYTDENDETAWEVYDECMFLPGHTRPVPAAEGKEGEGGGEEEGGNPAAAAADYVSPSAEDVQRLEGAWTEDKFMRSVSGMKSGRPGETRRNAGKGPAGEGPVDVAKQVKFEDAGDGAQSGPSRRTTQSAMELD